MKKITIKLKNASKVFPNKISRIRPHDLIVISHKKREWLSLKEQEKLQNLADKIREEAYEGEMDILVRRSGKKLNIALF